MAFNKEDCVSQGVKCLKRVKWILLGLVIVGSIIGIWIWFLFQRAESNIVQIRHGERKILQLRGGVTMTMIYVAPGSFMMGSPSAEIGRDEDGETQHRVTLTKGFWLGETEVTQAQWYNVMGNNPSIYKDPLRPVNNISWFDCQKFIARVNEVVRQQFGCVARLPFEAEWEYAARGGTSTPYFFEGSPKKLSNDGFLKGIFKPDTTGINTYAVYMNNSSNRTQEPGKVKANPFGLKNMLGNVMEYCEDWYAEDAYASIQDGQLDPKGPAEGTERVVRGGHYNDDASQLRTAARSHTEHDEWLRTDPQNPKSIWWYSDVKGIGFRVVCEVPETINNK